MPQFSSFDPAAQSADQFARLVFGDASLALVPASALARYGSGYGTAVPLAVYDGSIAGLGIGRSLMLTTGGTDVGAPGVAASMSTVLDAPAAPAAVAAAAEFHLGYPGSLQDTTVFEFQFTLTNPNQLRISFDLMFATEEVPGSDGGEFADFAAVFLNGTNVGVFGARNYLPLAATTLNETQGLFRSNLGGTFPLGFDRVSQVVTVTTGAAPGANTLRIVVADTGDALLDSAVFVGNLRAASPAGLVPIGTGYAILPPAGAPEGTPPLSGDDAANALAGSDKVVSDLLLGLGGNDDLVGGPGDDTLRGGDGDDALDYPLAGAPLRFDTASGGAHGGSDDLEGGPGNDVYVVNPGDRVFESPGEGNDWIVSAWRTSLAGRPAVENLQLLARSDGSVAESGTGNALGNYLIGSDGDDTLLGLGGDDALDGRAGDDALHGSDGNDSLAGGAGDDFLAGGAGNDAIDGGAGHDTTAYARPIDDYRLQRIGVTWQITDERGTDGSDRLWSVESAVFAGRSYPLAAPEREFVPDPGRYIDFLFDPVYYLLSNPALGPGITPDTAAAHWRSSGAAQGLDPNAWFDASFYENRWADLKNANLDDATLFAHYNLYGVWEGRWAAAKLESFDGPRYLAENPDVAAFVDANLDDFLGSRTNGAIAHYLIFGADEQRLAYAVGGQPVDLGYVI